MNNIIVEPPPIDPYAKWKRVIAEMKSVTAKMTPFIDFLTKSLPVAAAAATATAYILLLGYTSRYSIPFPYTFLPYLVMLSVVIVLALMVMGVAAFFPLYLRVFIPDTEYHKMLKVGAEGGLLWWRRCPQLIRQFVNLIAPAIAFEFVIIVDVAFQDIKNLTPTVGVILFFSAGILQGFFFQHYIGNNYKLKYDNKNVWLLPSVISYSMLGSLSFLVWFVFVMFFLLKIPQIANYSGDLDILLTLVLLVSVFLAQVFLFLLLAIGNRRYIIKFAIFCTIFIILFAVVAYPGGNTLIKNALFKHNLGGGVVTTLSVKGKDACQHLNDLVKETPETAPEGVCTTKPVAVLLNIGDTIYVEEASSAAAAAEPDGEKLAGGENNTQTPDGAEKVWSVNRSTVIGMEFQSRGKLK